MDSNWVVFSVLILIQQAHCSTSNDLAESVDRLLVFHNFERVKELIKISPGNREAVCTSQVIARCVDLCNYTQRSFISEISNLLAPESIKYEAKELLDLLLPYATREVLTRAFNLALFHGHEDLIHRLLNKYGIRHFEADEEGISPLMMTAEFRRFKWFYWLLDKGADIRYVNFNGENIVHHLARHQSHQNAQFLYFVFFQTRLNESDLNLPNNKEQTPLNLAYKSQNEHVINILT